MSDDEQQGEDGAGGRGRIGVQIYEQVEQLVKEHGISRTEAFQRLSEETGRRAGTVAANYYRIARQRGGGRARRAPRATTGVPARRGRRPRLAGGDIEAALAQVQSALDELAGAVRRQEAEMASLREGAEQLRELRKWMSKNVR
ncbi:MAG: hypothetical protein QOD86_2333 [Miltoncostaeaceae bacterium]|jgi:hypothetical protein|nr:hypothetical protein [Miltoncostaeaceae bacterium]